MENFTDFAVTQEYENVFYAIRPGGFFFDVGPGESFFMPSGTPHAVDTIEDSLFLMTSILSKYHIPMSIANLELIEIGGEGEVKFAITPEFWVDSYFRRLSKS